MKNNMIKDSELISRTLYREMDKYEKLDELEVRSLYGSEFVEGTSIIRQLEDVYHDLFQLNQQYNFWEVTENIYRTHLDKIPYKDIKKYQHVIKKAEAVLGKRYHLRSSKEMVEVFDKYHSARENLEISVSEIYLEEIFDYLIKLMNLVMDYFQNYERKISKAAYTEYMPKDRIYASNELRNKIFLGHIYLAKIYASKYYKELRREVPYDDLFQTASMGLLIACHYYSVNDKRAKFTTYASKCIDNMLRRTYVKPRKKKRHTFEQERFNISLAETFVDSIFVYDDYHHDYSVSTYWVNSNIRKFNKACEALGNKKYYGNMVSRLNKVKESRNETQEKHRIGNVYTDILKMVSRSELNLLIDDSEREMINALFDYRNFHKKTKDIYLLKEYLKTYREKLGNIALYLNVEKDLMTKSNGEIPTKEEILKEMNKRLRQYNKKDCYVRFDSLKSYYDGYLETFHIDLLAEDGDNNRADEYAEIFDYWENNRGWDARHIIKNYQEVLAKIEKAQKFHPLLHVNVTVTDDSYDYEIPAYEFELVLDSEDNLTLAEAKEFINGEIAKLSEFAIDGDLYVKNVLNERRRQVNAILKEYNDPIILHNQAIKEDVYQSSFDYKRKPYRMSTLDEIIDDTELLYSDNIEFLDYLANNPRTKRARQNLEEEVATMLFMEDYYNALKELPDLEQFVMYYWYNEEGIHDYDAKLIAEKLHMTTKEVRQIKEKAIKKLQKNKKLSSYLNY